MNFLNKILARIKAICEKNKFTAKIYAICEKNSELIRYIFCGGLTTVFNLVIYLIASRFIFGNLIDESAQISSAFFEGESLVALLSNAVAWMLAVAFAFFVNKVFVFCDDTKGKALIPRILEFYAFRVVTGVLEIFLPSLLIVSLSINDVISKVTVSVIIILGNYFFTKFVTFRKSRNHKNTSENSQI